MYRMDVTQNAGAAYWCIEELSFYDADGARIPIQQGNASSESEYSPAYAASMAFNELTDDDASWYCSQNGISTGWLQYSFEPGMAPVVTYAVERLNGFGNQFSPVAWQMRESLDGGNSWIVIDEQSGHLEWDDGEVRIFPQVALT